MFTVEVCTGLGLGLVAQSVQVCAVFEPSSDDSNQMLYGTFQALSGHYFFAKKNT
jgi:hypothetical protein